MSISNTFYSIIFPCERLLPSQMHEKGTTTSYLFLGGSLASALMQVRAALTLAAACTKAVHHLDHLENVLPSGAMACVALVVARRTDSDTHRMLPATALRNCRYCDYRCGALLLHNFNIPTCPSETRFVITVTMTITKSESGLIFASEDKGTSDL
jgi:hypothetical protein